MLMIDIEIPGRRLSSHLSKQSLVFEIILFIDSSKKHPLRSLSFFLSYSPTCGPRLLCTLLDVKKFDRRDSSVFDSACLRFAYQSFLMSKAHLNLRYSFLSSSVKTETAS
jgi:hypothetical protein